MTATTTSGTVEHDDYPGRLLMEARAEIERLREAKRRALEMADLRSKENVELRERLWSIREDLAHIVEQIDLAIQAATKRLAQ